MATKLFKSITIDGDTYKLEDSLGRSNYKSKSVNIPTANTNVIGAEIDINEAGMYLIFARGSIGPSSITGNKYNNVGIGIKFAGSSSYTFNTTQTSIVQQANAGCTLLTAYQYSFSQSQIPAKVCVMVNSSQTSSTNEYTSINAVKVVHT